MNRAISFPLFLFITYFLSTGISLGQVYKYQDAQGNWHFTDSPERVPKNAQTVKGLPQTQAKSSDLKKRLYEKFSPRNALEEATLGTVTIKTPLGFGSGFFINEEGYIITNKHVVRPDEKIKEKASNHYDRIDRAADQTVRRLAAEEDRLQAMQESLEKVKKLSEEERNPSLKALLEDKYKTDRATLERVERDFEVRKKDFSVKKEAYEREKRDYFSKTSRADRSMSFTIVLKDNSEQDAHLVAISQNNDLALLKIDGCRTPSLKPGRLDHVFQGERVYAIGSPAGLKDSVSAGVISGYDGYFLRTDARIYPGNSGGPLVNQKGEVIGINTWKEITHKFEGLGFAINLDAAIREFDKHAKMRSEAQQPPPAGSE